MSKVIYLSPNDIVVDRPFTHPDLIEGDRKTLGYMLSQLALLLAYPDISDNHLRTVLFHCPDRGEWFHRLVLAQPETARVRKPLIFVGFFGQRREDGDRELVHEFDRTLCQEISEHPGLCSYSTMALTGGNYGNLVIFTNREARDHWSTSVAHAQAVDRLSPKFYLSVVIYNGVLPNGIQDGRTLQLIRTKYFDYRSKPMWYGIRELNQNGVGDK